MCLTRTTTGKPKIAKEDKECFKVMYRTTDTTYLSLYQDFHYEINKKYYADKEYLVILQENYILRGGGFHSYIYLPDAYSALYHSGGLRLPSLTVVKCIIPKGSLYYVGKDDNGDLNFFSSDIIIKEEI